MYQMESSVTKQLHSTEITLQRCNTEDCVLQ